MARVLPPITINGARYRVIYLGGVRYEPMPLVRRRDPFDDRDWLFELKWDGWRSLAYVNGGGAALVSRKVNRFGSFPDLASTLSLEVNADDAVLDGEIVKLDENGRPVFVDLMRRGRPFTFVAFDVLVVNGKDIRRLGLTDRKKILRAIVPKESRSVLYAQHVKGRGRSRLGWRPRAGVRRLAGAADRACGLSEPAGVAAELSYAPIR
jgi:ATP-dependent DNA ligase